jgi:hypothetical protein
MSNFSHSSPLISHPMVKAVRGGRFKIWRLLIIIQLKYAFKGKIHIKKGILKE